MLLYMYFFSSCRRHTRCALVTGVQTCALPISPRRRAVMCPWLLRPLAANATPSGKVTAETWRTLSGELLRAADAEGPFDGILLALHEIGRASCRASVCQYV